MREELPREGREKSFLSRSIFIDDEPFHILFLYFLSATATSKYYKGRYNAREWRSEYQSSLE